MKSILDEFLEDHKFKKEFEKQGYLINISEDFLSLYGLYGIISWYWVFKEITLAFLYNLDRKVILKHMKGDWDG